MQKQVAMSILLSSAMAASIAVAVLADSVTETEANNTTATANSLLSGDVLTGSINPVGDVDYFSIAGVNTTWGFVALLETISSTNSLSGTLTALASDGTTVLQSDTRSWERGSGIALQNYASGSATHFLKVNELGNDATITPYKLRYYRTVVNTQPEVETNDTRSTGTPSSFTMSGTISAIGDKDCYAFYGRAGDTILLALNGDPDGDGSNIDPVLELIDPSDVILKSADVSGTGGKEFIEYGPLASSGVYAYCVRAGSGTGGVAATYKAGIVRNGGLYDPSYDHGATWLNPPPSGNALVGSLLSFRLSVTNTSPLTIPGNIRITASYSSTCLGFVSGNPPPSTTSPGYVSWDGQKPGGLSPGEVYSVTMNMLALAACNDKVHQDLYIAYFFTGTSSDAYYIVLGNRLFLPLIKK